MIESSPRLHDLEVLIDMINRTRGTAWGGGLRQGEGEQGIEEGEGEGV